MSESGTAGAAAEGALTAPGAVPGARALAAPGAVPGAVPGAGSLAAPGAGAVPGAVLAPPGALAVPGAVVGNPTGAVAESSREKRELQKRAFYEALRTSDESRNGSKVLHLSQNEYDVAVHLISNWTSGVKHEASHASGCSPRGTAP